MTFVSGPQVPRLLLVLAFVAGCNSGTSGPGTDLPFPEDSQPDFSRPDVAGDTASDLLSDHAADLAQDLAADAPQDDATDTRMDGSWDAQIDAPSDVCSPDCVGKDCGDDGCGGSCGGCDDDNPCTDDDCGPQGGCINVPNEALCDDGNECTDGDLCAEGICVSGANLCACDTDDDCPAWADPDDPCKGTLYCDMSEIPTVCEVVLESVVTCDPGLDTPCAVQECLPETGQCGAVPVNEGGPCDDGIACSWPDLCEGGACVGATGGCEEFSVILLPDTQYYSWKMPDNATNTYYKQTQWVVENQEAMNIQVAIHLGDITHNNTTSEWVIADSAHAILDDAGVPYTVLPGNHDYYPNNPFTRGQTKLNDYFGPDRFQDEPWYGGSFESKSDNNYAYFESWDDEFLVLSLEHAPRKDALCWANDVIAAHPSHRVIIATHCYLTHGGGYSSGCATSYDIPGSSGLVLWEELASRHSNVFLVTSGHIGDSEYVPVTGNAGNTVHQMLVDYQFEATCSFGACGNACHAGFYTGNGWLRRLIFSPAENMIHAQTLTVEEGNQSIFPQGFGAFFCSELSTQGENHYDMDSLDADHTFSFAYDLTSPLAPYQYAPPESGAFNDRTVNSAGSGQQLVPAVAMNPAGDIVIAWEDDSSSADGSGNHDILARGFTRGGCESFPDIVVNGAVTSGQQDSPAVAMDSGGGFVVTWRDDNDGNGYGQIYARGFDADGAEAFAVIPVNSVETGRQRNPAVGMAAGGGFVIAWEDDSDSGDGSGNYDIHARVFHAGGAEKVADLVVNSDTAGQQLAPAIAMAQDGGFVVTWEDDTDGNGMFQIKVRGFHDDGAEAFGQFTVNTVATGQQLSPVIAMDGFGSFVIAWEDDSDSSDGTGNHDIFARGFDAAGVELFPDLMVNAAGDGQQRVPAVAVRAGGFVVTWEDDSDGNGKYQIHARGFDATGTQDFGEMAVNVENAGQQLAPTVAVDETGVFVVAWEDDMDNNDYFQIMARGIDW